MYEKFAKNELKNNLFEYATSELSQDAFICWLASYAHEEAEKDAALNPAGEESFRPGPHGLNDERPRNPWGTGEMFIKQRVFPRKPPCAPHLAVPGTIHPSAGNSLFIFHAFCVPIPI